MKVGDLPAIIPPEKREGIVERGFWPKLRRVAAQIPFADDIVAAYYCARDPKTPLRVRGVIIASLAYFVVPTDLIPDFITGLGFTDDATVLATTLGIVGAHVKARHRQQARAALGLPEPNDPEDI